LPLLSQLQLLLPLLRLVQLLVPLLPLPQLLPHFVCYTSYKSGINYCLLDLPTTPSIC